MTAASIRLDLEVCRRRTRWTMSLSVVAHALLFLWIATHKSAVAELPVVTEIMLLEPGDLASASAPSAPAPAPAAPARGQPPKGSENVHFRRTEEQAGVSLDSQLDQALSDKLTSRLEALQREEQPLPAGTASASVPSTLFGTRPATVVGPGGSGSAPVKLTRGGGTGGTAALELSRGTTPGAPAALAPASIASAKSEAGPAPAKAGESTAQRTIAGVSLMGPIADRPVLFYSLPVYPEWAKREAVEGSVTLYFVVRPDGTVKENVLVQKTAGFGDFDDNARTTLRAWRFAPLRGGRTGEQWGTITFHFRLRSAG